MISVVISLLVTAYSILKSEIEARQKMGADVAKMVQVLHSIERCWLELQ